MFHPKALIFWFLIHGIYVFEFSICAEFCARYTFSVYAVFSGDDVFLCVVNDELSHAFLILVLVWVLRMYGR